MQNNPLSGTDPSGFGDFSLSGGFGDDFNVSISYRFGSRFVYQAPQTGCITANAIGCYSKSGVKSIVDAIFDKVNRPLPSYRWDDGLILHYMPEGWDSNDDDEDSSQTVEVLSDEFQEMLASESFQRAVRVAMGAAGSEMTRPRDYSNRYEPLPVRYQQSTGAMIVEKSVFRAISDSAYRKIPGNDDYALGEVSSDVAKGNMNGGWRRGGIAGNMHGNTVAISGAEAVAITMAPFESTADLLEGNLRAIQQTFKSISPTVPLVISAGGKTFLIEGTTGPIEYDGF